MKIGLIVLILIVIDHSFYAQDLNSNRYKYAILTTDSIKYKRRFVDIDGKLIIDTNSITIFQKSLLKVLKCISENNSFLIENYSMNYSDGADDEPSVICINKDTLIIVNDKLYLIDSVSIPGKYYSNILNDLYGKQNDSPPIIYELDFIKDKNLCFISYNSNDGRMAYSSSSVYKITNEKAILYFDSYCDDCIYDIFNNYFVVYNRANAEVFDTNDYAYDNKLNQYTKKDGEAIYRIYSPSRLSIDSKDEILLYDKSKHEFIKKKKIDKGFYYETFGILHGEFKKIK